MFGIRRNQRHTAKGKLLRVVLPFFVLFVCLYTLDWSYMMLETGFDGGLRVLTEKELGAFCAASSVPFAHQPATVQTTLRDEKLHLESQRYIHG